MDDSPGSLPWGTLCGFDPGTQCIEQSFVHLLMVAHAPDMPQPGGFLKEM